jgi:ABC-type branched-subunit amino acid transport system ATPase component
MFLNVRRADGADNRPAPAGRRMKSPIGELKPKSGEFVFDGISTHNDRAEHRVRCGIGYVPLEQAIFGGLTVRENLLLGAVRYLAP